MIATRKDPAVLLRLPKKVLTGLSRKAKKNGRSRNTEIVVRLVESLGLGDKASTAPPAAGPSPAPDPVQAIDADRVLAPTP